MRGDVTEAIELVQAGNPAFFKFIAANETGETGGHQCGYYIPKDFLSFAFDGPCRKGSNRDLTVDVNWNNGQRTRSRFVYYGRGTRNEARVTTFGKGFQYLKSEYTGALIVFIKESWTSYHSYVFNSEEEIDEFLGALGLGPVDAGHLIRLTGESVEVREKKEFAKFIRTLKTEFPTSVEMSAAARRIEDIVYDHADYILDRPDRKLISWSEVEYRLFRAIESDRYGQLVANGFDSVEEFVSKANEVLNRRKSRAGKSLEHHLGAIFDGNGIQYEEQVVTEGSKRPDFIFPSSEAYHDAHFPDGRLIFLAAKTTCKDRWRQILNEADRFKNKTKFLCTLQQGISEKQLNEMAKEKVVLVVPKPFINSFPAACKSGIWTVQEFVDYALANQGH